MRDINRIFPFANKLAAEWQKVPDWRFGQFMMNFLSWVQKESGRDIFFIEDDEMEKYLAGYIDFVMHGEVNKD